MYFCENESMEDFVTYTSAKQNTARNIVSTAVIGTYELGTS